MTPSYLTVNGQPFFGRVEEQKQFRAALHELLAAPEGETLPYVFLLFGDGGIGKTTLARRFRDIARDEHPDAFAALWLDWEVARISSVRLDVDRAQISAEAVLDTLHTALKSAGWAEHAQPYEAALVLRTRAEQSAARIFTPGGERDSLAALRSLSQEEITRLVREPSGGDAERQRLRTLATERLQAQLEPVEFEMFRAPRERLAAALAEGLRAIAAERPLLLFLDTYEIVDRADPWLRVAVRQAGPRVLWVIAGRDDLRRRRRFGDEYVQGYAEDFPRRLVPFDMRQLARDDVRDYFAAVVPGRPLDAGDLDAITRATRGIPLAVREAADIWKDGRPLADIVRDIPEGAPGPQIVRTMTERYQLHCIRDAEDKRALYALALARGDSDILRAMLRPAADTPPPPAVEPRPPAGVSRQKLRDILDAHCNDNDLRELCFELDLDYDNLAGENKAGKLRELILHQVRNGRYDELVATTWRLRPNAPWEDTPPNASTVSQPGASFSLEEELVRLERDYASVHREQARLHDEPAAFFLEALRQPVMRGEPWLRQLVDRAVDVLRARLARLEANLPRLEDRCADDDWVNSAITLADFLFWRDEDEAWRWLVPRYVEGMGYNDELRIGLLQVAATWGTWLSASGRKRVRLLHAEGDEQQGQLLEELERLAGLGWFDGEHQDEHKLLLEVNRARHLISTTRLKEATHVLNRVTPSLRATQRVLHRRTARRWESLGRSLFDLGQYAEAIHACKMAISLVPSAQGYTYLGFALRNSGRLEEAIEAHKLASSLAPKESYPYNNIASIYQQIGQIEQALNIIDRSISLNPSNATAYHVKGNILRELKQYNQAVINFERSLSIDPKTAYAHMGLGRLYQETGEYIMAITHYQEAALIEPTAPQILVNLGYVYCNMGRWNDALAVYQRAIDLKPDAVNVRFSLARTYHKLGRDTEAQQQLDLARPLLAHETEYNRACFEAICGNTDEALSFLETALAKKQVSLAWARRDPDFEAIRDDPRFRALVGLDAAGDGEA
jgi:tetratricopeptide (TPR) repeat protein